MSPSKLGLEAEHVRVEVGWSAGLPGPSAYANSRPDRLWDRWVSGADRRLLSWRAQAWAQSLAKQRDVTQRLSLARCLHSGGRAETP
jgi:hypothetical protein